MRETIPSGRGPVDAEKPATRSADPILKELAGNSAGPAVEDAADVDAAQHWQEAAREAAHERGRAALLPLAVPAPARPRPWRGLARGVGWERVTRLILAFVMALLLWFYVIGLQNPSRTQTFALLSIQVRGLTDDLAVRSDLGTATVTVQAPEDVLSRLRAGDFTIFVNATGLGPGRQTLPVEVQHPEGYMDVTVDPAEVTVQLDVQTQNTFSVRVRAQGDPGGGYQLEGPQIITPTQVLLRGWQDQVAQVVQVVAEIDINGRQTTQTARVRPRALDDKGREVSGLTYDPPYVQVSVPIQLLVNLKTLPVRVRVAGDPAPDYRVIEIAVQPTTLTVQGSPAVLGPLNYLETEPIPITNTTQTVLLSAKVLLTAGVTLASDQPSMVDVRVAVEEITTLSTVAVRVQSSGLGPGLDATISPDRVEVRINGPFVALQNLDPTSFAAILDLSNLAPGTHTLTPTITVPDGTRLVGFTPTVVTVTIVAQPTAVPTPAPPTPTPLVPPALSPTPGLPGTTPDLSASPTASGLVPTGGPVLPTPVLSFSAAVPLPSPTRSSAVPAPSFLAPDLPLP